MAGKKPAKEKALPWYQNYAQWFTNEFANDYVSMFPARFRQAPLSEKRKIFNEAKSTVVLYSFLIYKYYPSMPEFREQIDSNSELQKNFGVVKSWLEKNNGREVADQFQVAMQQLMTSTKQGAV